MVSARSSTEQGEGQGAEGKPKKRVSFNPVVEYFYYSQLDWMPDELKRLGEYDGGGYPTAMTPY